MWLAILLAINFLHPSFNKLIELEGMPETWVKVNGTGLERIDLIDTVGGEERETIVQLCKDIGLFDKVDPTQDHYETAVVYGSMMAAEKKRIDHLLELWEQGIRFNKVFFLGGDRVLRPEEIEEVGSGTEFDMVRTLMERAPFPSNFPPRVAVLGVGAAGRRANTRDTLLAIQNELVPPLLAIATPMFVHYQHALALNVLGKDFPLDTCAKEAPIETIKVSVMLDTLGKIVYETTQ